MARGIRKQEGEDLSESNIARVILELEKDKPVTKTAACAMLSISYNPKRLGTIIANHKDTLEHRAKMRKKLRNEPIDTATASEIVSNYMSGTSIADISASTYRSTAVVKRVLRSYNTPIRSSSVDYQNPIFLDDDALANDYKKGDLVYSARYDCPATVDTISDTEKYGMVYGLWIHGTRRRQVSQPHYELADLRRVQTELGIKMYDLDKDEVTVLINEGLRNQKLQEDKRK